MPWIDDHLDPVVLTPILISRGKRDEGPFSDLGVQKVWRITTESFMFRGLSETGAFDAKTAVLVGANVNDAKMSRVGISGQFVVSWQDIVKVKVAV